MMENISRTAHAPPDDLNGTVKNRYVIFLLSPQSVAGDIGQRKQNRREAGVPFLLAHKGFGEGTSPSRPQGRNSPRQGAQHRNGVYKKESLLKQRDEAKKEAAQYENQVKILLNKQRDAERHARNHRLIVHGAIMEGVFPFTASMDGESLKAFLIDLSRLPGAEESNSDFHVEQKMTAIPFLGIAVIRCLFKIGGGVLM